MSRHEFAFYSEEVSNIKHCPGIYALQDAYLKHRLFTILRLSEDDLFILFNRRYNIKCRIVSCTKKNCQIFVEAIYENKKLTPEIHWLLPLLEREAFEQAIAILVAVGVSSICPVVTEKSRRKWGAEKDKQRIQRLIISSAEQSKNFIFPEILNKTLLREGVENSEGEKIYFDSDGDSSFDVMNILRNKKLKDVTCLVGPESDLTAQEKRFVRDHNFIICRLTPTVLRAWHAVAIGAGMMRSHL